MPVETVIQFLMDNPLVGFAWGTACLFLALWFRNRARGLRMAEWVVAEGQYQPLPADLLDDALREAEKQGQEKAFLRYLTEVRRLYGHGGVRVGHLYWIWHQLENPSEMGVPPSFARPSSAAQVIPPSP